MAFNSINIEIPSVDLTDLDFLASLISPEIASASPLSSPTSPASSGYASELYPSSSSGSSSPTSTYFYPSPSPFPSYETPTATPSATPSFFAQGSSNQYFFPSTFSQALSTPPPPAAFNPAMLQSSMSSFLAQDHSPIYGDKLLTIEKSGLKNRRASRSKCPCLKCCHARANHIPSPTYHGCIVKGCQKTYTRPAHLRSHLKSHDNDTHLKCVICSDNFMSSDLLIAHMFEHGMIMKS